MNAPDITTMGACPVEFERMRSALEHIAKTARASRSQHRRIRWIEQRAQRALDGLPYEVIDLPKHSSHSTSERLGKQFSAAKCHNRALVQAAENVISAFDQVELGTDGSRAMKALHETVLDATWLATAHDDPEAPVPATAKPADLRLALELARRSTKNARLSGRAEALAILLNTSAELFVDKYIGESSIGGTGDYASHWKQEALFELLDLAGDDSTISLIDRMDAVYWENAHRMDEMQAVLLWALHNHLGYNSPVGQPVRQVLAMGRAERLTPEQIAKANSVSTWVGHDGSDPAA